MKCLFCGQTEDDVYGSQISREFNCPRCGDVRLTRECLDDFESQHFSETDRKIMSICLRTGYERQGRQPPSRQLTLEDLHQMAHHYRRLDPLEIMDRVLLNLGKLSEYAGDQVFISLSKDVPYYHCFSDNELENVLEFLVRQEFIESDRVMALGERKERCTITPKGYERLRELRELKDSRQCFVAMWLVDEMNKVYDEAISPAIEYKETGESEPRFKALKIDNKEHTNDINDEIISEIRRSRFMVCDLTGYRGGVYFEAGFAYGLGLEVIYTCREDWIEKQVTPIIDSEGKKHEDVQEGIHFDLEHRNRITWTDDALPEFKEKLENHIKAVIV